MTCEEVESINDRYFPYVLERLIPSPSPVTIIQVNALSSP